MRWKIEVPDDFLSAVRLPEGEIEGEARKELALAFYARGALSLGKAVELSGLRRPEFERTLGERRIERPYSESEIDQDLAWAKAKEE